MKREILISASPKESRVAILEDGELMELMIDRPDANRLVGDIYLGRLTAVLPGIQAAFVDLGTGKAGFLHVSDVAHEGMGDDDEEDDRGDGRRQRRYPPIQELVKKGDEILIQVTKEAIGTKGPRVSAQISLPGRFLVYMPYANHVGVSRKIEDREERARLRKLAREILPDGAGGLIVRTVGEELSRETFEREFKTLHATWEKIQRRAKSSKPPAVVHREAKLISGIIRDLFTDKVDALIVNDKQILNEIRLYLRGVDPELVDRVRLYTEPVPLFDQYGIEEEIERAFQRNVELPSGGYLVIEPTEALVSIDVNTGRYTGRKDPESTILRTNLDAAKQIARQLRLRDIGGIIVCDFIDMESQQNRDRVLQELRSHLGRDRARTKAFEVSELGLIEMTRQRVRPSLLQTLTEPCAYCSGGGRVFTPETVTRRLERAVLRVGIEGKEKTLTVRVHPDVALHIMEDEPDFLRWLSKRSTLEIDLRDDPLMRRDEFRLLAGPADTDITARYLVT
ncbi:MAG: Rne/Rng family ribonuclease [Gemmatimonadetes bacterium]|nr:Rne/Rng family ribonuclease [Gemmatimonadota bacterium]